MISRPDFTQSEDYEGPVHALTPWEKIYVVPCNMVKSDSQERMPSNMTFNVHYGTVSYGTVL